MRPQAPLAHAGKFFTFLAESSNAFRCLGRRILKYGGYISKYILKAKRITGYSEILFYSAGRVSNILEMYFIPQTEFPQNDQSIIK